MQILPEATMRAFIFFVRLGQIVFFVAVALAGAWLVLSGLDQQAAVNAQARHVVSK